MSTPGRPSRSATSSMYMYTCLSSFHRWREVPPLRHSGPAASRWRNSLSRCEYNSLSRCEYKSPSRCEYNSPSHCEYNSPSRCEYNSPSRCEYNWTKVPEVLKGRAPCRCLLPKVLAMSQSICDPLVRGVFAPAKAGALRPERFTTGPADAAPHLGACNLVQRLPCASGLGSPAH
eukprot:361839-Chlamydomonas_euryale.AAC.4